MNKDELTSTRLPEDDVEIPGVGTVRVRALSRFEVMLIQKVELDAGATERKMVAYAMIDPKMSEKDVESWQKAAPAGEMEPVTEKISALSGLDDKADKEAMLRFRSEPDA